MNAGHFRFKNVSTGDLNRPRSPEVRKPLVYFWFFSYKRKARKTSLCREFRGSANLKSAHRSRSFAPQQLNPFPKGIPRFRKPRISTRRLQLHAKPIKSFCRPRRIFPTFCKIQKVGQKTLKLSFRKVCPCRGSTPCVLFRRLWRHHPCCYRNNSCRFAAFSRRHSRL